MTLVLDRYPEVTYDAGIPHLDDPAERLLRYKWEAAISYRIFAAMRWGQLGDGHVSIKDPVKTDHMWVLGYGVPFAQATIDDLVLVSPAGEVVEGPSAGGVNFAAHYIHAPVLAATPDLVSAAHTHTQWGTPWSALVSPFDPISQESCAFVFDQSIYRGEDLEVNSYDGGRRIAAAMGDTKLCILRNHGLLTGGGSPAEAVGWFVLAERVAEVHLKAPAAVPISEEAAKRVALTFSLPAQGWRVWQWLARDLVPDPSVVLS